MVAFVRSNLQPDIRRANFVIVLEWLKNLSEKDDMSLQEACVMTLCRLARFVHALLCFRTPSSLGQNSVSEDEEKNIILLRLMEYLGHPNPYVCAVAYNEVCEAHPYVTLSFQAEFCLYPFICGFEQANWLK
jgi:serine/threonine-protein kinase ATR